MGREKVSVVQKEYPTAGTLGKSRRQNRDISLIKSPISAPCAKTPLYDYLRLGRAIEFGLNATREHLEDDIGRLSHSDSNVENGIVVHLYRLSEDKSNRDLSPNTGQLVSPEDMLRMVRGTAIEAYCALSGSSGRHGSCAYRADNEGIHELL